MPRPSPDHSAAFSRLRAACRRAGLPDGWWHVGWLQAHRLNRALRRELTGDHALARAGFSALAKSDSSDDVLFGLGDGRLALVHLSYTATPVDDAPYFSTFQSCEEFLDSLKAEATWEQAWIRSEELGEALAANGQSAICRSCGADWAANQTGQDCPLCDGWALARPCPHCDGVCGSLWSRAVLDSNDEGVPHWIGACAATP